MTHDGNLSIDDGIDHRHPLGATLQLDRLGTGTDQRRGVAHRIMTTGVVAHPWQVAHDERLRPGPSDRCGVMHHVVDGHLKGVLVSEGNHGQRVSDEDHVDTAGIGDAGRRGVVRRNHHQRLGAVTHLAGANLRNGRTVTHFAS